MLLLSIFRAGSDVISSSSAHHKSTNVVLRVRQAAMSWKDSTPRQE